MVKNGKKYTNVTKITGLLISYRRNNEKSAILCSIFSKFVINFNAKIIQAE